MNELHEIKQRITDLEHQLQREVWMDSQDVFEMLHISKRTLQYWRDNGLIPYYNIASKIWYKRSEIEAMLEQHKVHKNKLKLKTA